MTNVRKADPRARRQAVLLVLVVTLVAVILGAALERHPTALEDWLLSDPERLPNRIRLVLFALAAAISVPLAVFAAYIWSIGGKVVAAREFPPPGLRVTRDLPIRTGKAALLRGRALKMLALCLVGVAAWSWVLMAQLVETISERIG